MRDDREPTVDSDARRAVLETLSARKGDAKTEKKSASVTSSEFDETTPFETLLEASLDRRDEASEDEEKEKDEVRNRAINESQIDMIDDMMKRML